MLKFIFLVAGGISLMLTAQSDNAPPIGKLIGFVVFTGGIGIMLTWVLMSLGFQFDEEMRKEEKPSYEVDDWLDPGVTRRR